MRLRVKADDLIESYFERHNALVIRLRELGMDEHGEDAPRVGIIFLPHRAGGSPNVMLQSMVPALRELARWADTEFDEMMIVSTFPEWHTHVVDLFEDKLGLKRGYIK